MSWNNTDKRLGVVISVLSGDSFLIRYCGQDGPNYNIIKFPFTYAPSVSVIDESFTDETEGFEAWNYLREQLIGRRVYIGASIPTPAQKMPIVQLFDVEVSYSQAFLADEPEIDIEGVMLQSNFTRVRKLESVPEELKNDYQRYINMAKDQVMGNWGKTISIKKEIHPFSHKEILAKCDMKVIVTGVCENSFLLQVVTDKNVRFSVELAGIVHTNIATSSPFTRNIVGAFIADNMLTRKFMLRIHSRTPRGYLGTLSLNGRNIATSMISNGIARVNEMTSSYLANPKQMRTLEYNAKKQGRGIWDGVQSNEKRVGKFPATVIAVPSSTTLLIKTKEYGEELIYYSGIRVPEFDFEGKSQPFGYLAWKEIKDKLLEKEVYVTIDDERIDKKFATVEFGSECINEFLVRKGLAELSVSRVRKNPQCITKLHDAYLKAQDEMLGIFSEDKSDAVVSVHNITNEERALLMKDEASRKIVAIVIDVPGPVYMRLFVPSISAIINVLLVGLQPLEPMNWASRRSQEVLRDSFLNHTVDVTLTRLSEHSRYFKAIVYDHNTHLDARDWPVKFGLVRFSSKYADDRSDKTNLERYAEEARINEIGIYNDKMRGQSALSNKTIMPVVVTKVVNETTLAVKVINSTTEKIGELLNEPFSQLDMAPAPDQYTVLERNGINYRANVIKTKGLEAYVYLIDFGLSVWCFISDLRAFEEELYQFQPLAHVVSLAFIEPFSRHGDAFRQAAVNYINNIFVTGTKVYIRRSYDRELPCVQIFFDKDPKMSLQYALVNDGIVRVTEESVFTSHIPIVNELNKIMGVAKKAGIGGWAIHELQ